MKTTYTPGPWLAYREDDRFDSSETIMRIIDGSEYSLNHPQGPVTIATINVAAHAPHLEEPAANMALIAAAPDMLAALEWALQNAEWSNDSTTGTDPIRAAIAKARSA